MNEEEFFNRAINRICKDYDYSFANEFRLLFLKKEKEINNLQSKIDKAIEYIDDLCKCSDGTYFNYGDDLSPKHIVDILKEDK